MSTITQKSATLKLIADDIASGADITSALGRAYDSGYSEGFDVGGDVASGAIEIAEVSGDWSDDVDAVG